MASCTCSTGGVGTRSARASETVGIASRTSLIASSEMTPWRTIGCCHRGAGVRSRRRWSSRCRRPRRDSALPTGPPSRYTMTLSPSIRSASWAVMAAGSPVRLAERHGERSRLGQQLKRDGIVWHPQGDGAIGFAQVPLQRLLRGQDDREATRPERLDEGAHLIRNYLGERVQRGDARHEHGRRGRSRAVLRIEQTQHCVRIEGVYRNAIHGVGGHDDEVAAPDRGSREPHASEEFALIRAVIDGRHIEQHRSGSACACGAACPSQRRLGWKLDEEWRGPVFL